MNRPLVLIPMLLLVTHQRAALAAPLLTVTTDPRQVVIGQEQEVRITVKGLQGEGPVYADSNVGTVGRVEPSGDTVHITYRHPEQGYPQMLCLPIWRDRGPVHVIRIPLLGRTLIPVKTRNKATVRVIVAQQEFGPFPTKASGRVRVPVQVPPGVRLAKVVVTDRVGMQSRKMIPISQPRYNQLALAISPRTISRSSRPRFRITVAVADLERADKPELLVDDEPIALKPGKPGQWLGVWAPPRRPSGSIRIRALLPGDDRSEREAEVDIAASGVGELKVRVQRARIRRRAVAVSKWQGDIGVAMGMTHNLGDLVAPRLGVEVGVEYRMRLGLVGARLFASFGWASQQISAPGALDAADSSILLVPVGVALSYRAPLRYLTPYVMWGCMANVVRTTTTASYLEPELNRSDVVFGVLGLAGASRKLGPGRLFLQLGYQWSRVDNDDLAALTGGVVLEGGYRLEL